MDQGFEPEPKRTKRSKVGFPCNRCEYVATRAFTLKIHIENQHERKIIVLNANMLQQQQVI